MNLKYVLGKWIIIWVIIDTEKIKSDLLSSYKLTIWLERLVCELHSISGNQAYSGIPIGVHNLAISLHDSVICDLMGRDL